MARGDRWCFRPIVHRWLDSWWLYYRSRHMAVGVLCHPTDWYRCAAGAHLLDANTAKQKQRESFDRLLWSTLINCRYGTAHVRIHLCWFSICLALRAGYWPVCWSSSIRGAVYSLRGAPGKTQRTTYYRSKPVYEPHLQRIRADHDDYKHGDVWKYPVHTVVCTRCAGHLGHQ